MACTGHRAPAGVIVPDPAFSADEGTPRFPFRVAIAVFEDLRPPEERDMEARRLLGDSRYPYYTYDQEDVAVPIACGLLGLCATPVSKPATTTLVLNERLVERLRGAQLFERVEPFLENVALTTPERLKMLKEKGFDAVLTGKLGKWYGLSDPFFSGKVYTLFAGGVEYPKTTRISAEIRLEQVQLISLRTGQILWEGEVEHIIHRKGKRILPREAADEALAGGMNQVLSHLLSTAEDLRSEP